MRTSAMHSDQLALALEEVSRARQGERWRMIVERMALRAEAAALDLWTRWLWRSLRYEKNGAG